MRVTWAEKNNLLSTDGQYIKRHTGKSVLLVLFTPTFYSIGAARRWTWHQLRPRMCRSIQGWAFAFHRKEWRERICSLDPVPKIHSPPCPLLLAGPLTLYLSLNADRYVFISFFCFFNQEEIVRENWKTIVFASGLIKLLFQAVRPNCNCFMVVRRQAIVVAGLYLDRPPFLPLRPGYSIVYDVILWRSEAIMSEYSSRHGKW